MVRRGQINAIVDLCALLFFIPSIISGCVLFIVFPSGTGYQGGRNPLAVNEYLGLTHADWLAMHDYTSLIFAALVILHLLLHCKYFRNFKKHLVMRKNEPCDIE